MERVTGWPQSGRRGTLLAALIGLLVGCNQPAPPVTTQPVTTQPVTTQPVTTPPVTTPPVTTPPGRDGTGAEAVSPERVAAQKSAPVADPSHAVPKSAAGETAAAPAKPAETGASPPSSGGKHQEPLFVGWPQPQLVFLVTGQQMGYIEPCGCTGLVNQKGGLARRQTLSEQLASRGWPVVPIDVGNQIKRFGRQSELKFQMTSDALKKIGYRAVALGADDLRLSAGELAAQTVSAGDQPTPFLSANAAIFDVSLTPTHQLLTIGGKKIGITSVISDDWQKKIVGSEILLKPAMAALDEVMPKLRAAQCDLLILLAQASLDESRALSRKYPDFQLVVTAGGMGEPTFQPETIPESKALLVQVGLKGMFAGVIGVFASPQERFRYQRVPLDARFEDSPEMLALLASYQEQLKTLGFEQLGLKPVPHPSGKQFVGSAKCGECHTKAFSKWKETGHSHATDSLIKPKERSEIARHYDPECLSCHVTGWHPQQFFPYESGYLNLEKSPEMKGSGCENCHGPGSAHVAAEEGVGTPTPSGLQMLRTAMRLPLAQAEKKCQECHDLDNSPDFHSTGAFAEYWKKIQHLGLD